MTQAEQQANLDALMQRLYNRLANLSDRELEEDGSSILLNNIGKVKGLIYGLRYEEKEPEDPKPEVAPEATQRGQRGATGGPEGRERRQRVSDQQGRPEEAAH